MSGANDDIVANGADLARLRSLTCAKWTWHDPDVLAAWVADMDFPPVPAAVDAVRALVDRGDFGYNFDAEAKLGDVFAERQARLYGWAPDTERFRTLCDVMQGVMIALWARGRSGDGVVLLTPVYPPFITSVKKAGLRVISCPLDPDGWKLDAEALERAVDDRTSAILMCNPHNPTGRAFTRAELSAIAEVAERHDLLVVSDEIWADLTFAGAKHVPMTTVSDQAAARTVTITAASKAFNLAGLRCAVAHIGDDRVAEGVAAAPPHLFGAVSSLGAEATLAAWTHGDDWLVETRAFLEAQRDYLAERLAHDLPEVTWSVPEATYLAWLDMRQTTLGVNPARVLLEQGRVALSSGLDFGRLGAGFARLNFATSREILDLVLDRVIETVRAEPNVADEQPLAGESADAEA